MNFFLQMNGKLDTWHFNARMKCQREPCRWWCCSDARTSKRVWVPTTGKYCTREGKIAESNQVSWLLNFITIIFKCPIYVIVISCRHTSNKSVCTALYIVVNWFRLQSGHFNYQTTGESTTSTYLVYSREVGSKRWEYDGFLAELTLYRTISYKCGVWIRPKIEMYFPCFTVRTRPNADDREQRRESKRVWSELGRRSRKLTSAPRCRC